MIGSVPPASVFQNCKRLIILPCKWALGLSSRMAHQLSDAAFERPRDSDVEESKGFDPPNTSPAPSRVPLGAMSLNTPARLRRRSAKQGLAESMRKIIITYREQSRVQEVVEERQREEKARAQQQARTQQQTRAHEARNSRRRQQLAE